MATSLHLLDHPVCLAVPERTSPCHSAEHVPFAMWLISVLRPQVLVELGTFRGTSYCGFCQAISTLGFPTRAFAVGTWKEDRQSGDDGPKVLEELRLHHDPRYASFSTLIPMPFDDAAGRFSDGEIDVLLINGSHEYEAVRHDYEICAPA